MALSFIRNYTYLSRWAFGVTCITNLICEKDADPELKENPIVFGSALLLKGIMNGMLWPTIPFQLSYNPDGFFCLGKGIERSPIAFARNIANNPLKSLPKWKVPY